jgi:hypothetical protein
MKDLIQQAPFFIGCRTPFLFEHNEYLGPDGIKLFIVKVQKMIQFRHDLLNIED